MDSRNWVSVDRFALFDIATEAHLRSSDLVVLWALVMLANYRTWEWTEPSSNWLSTRLLAEMRYLLHATDFQRQA